MAPAAGFEPATKWLTATYSTAELCRNVDGTDESDEKCWSATSHFHLLKKIILLPAASRQQEGELNHGI